jgi:hypothetical protein
MSSFPRWQPGDQVLVRFIRNRPADLILPVTMVHDGDDHLAYFTAVGTPMKGQATAAGQALTRATPFIERERSIGGLADFNWRTNHALVVTRPDWMSAISLFWNASTGEFVGYYGNIQAPLVRTSRGFDSADYLLDVVIDPDLTPHWKDEDEWEEARQHGLLSISLLDAVRAEGERIMAMAARHEWPFDGSLVAWRPDPEWAVPQLPPDWDEGLMDHAR